MVLFYGGRARCNHDVQSANDVTRVKVRARNCRIDGRLRSGYSSSASSPYMNRSDRLGSDDTHFSSCDNLRFVNPWLHKSFTTRFIKDELTDLPYITLGKCG
jgi:hypothetical protein